MTLLVQAAPIMAATILACAIVLAVDTRRQRREGDRRDDEPPSP